MDYWPLLHQTIEKTIATGRIGTPVFARCTAAMMARKTDDQIESLYRSVAIMASYISAWLAADVENVYLIGNEKKDCLSLSLECISGATALLSVSTTTEPHIDLTLLGTEGAIYHQEAIQLLAGDRFFEAPLLPQRLVRLQQLQQAVEQAARSGQPVSLDAKSLS